MTSGRELDSRHLRFALARALVWGPGYGVVRAAAPSFLLLLLLSVAIFGGNGLHPRTILEWVMPRPFAFWLLCLSWVVFSARAYRAAVLDQSWPVLRTLPIGTARLCTALAVAVLLLELPWLALWGFGDGLILLGLMGLLSSGLSLAWLPLPKMRNLRLAQVAFLGAVGWCASQLTPRAVEASGAVSRSAVLASGLTLVALVLVVLTARTAWWRLLERPTGSARAIAMRSPVVALARAYTVSLYRRCGRMLLASTLLYAGAAALSIIMFGRSQERLEAQVSFTVAALCCAAVISTAALARSLAEVGLPAELAPYTPAERARSPILREFLAAQANQSQVVARMVIRYRDGLHAAMRIVHRGKVYNPAGFLPDADSGLEYLTIPVTQGVNDG